MNNTFESIRDKFFFDPHNPAESAGRLAESASFLIRSMVDPEALIRPDYEGDVAEDDLISIARQLAQDSQGALNIDHLSVAHLLPAGNFVALLARTASGVRNNNTVIPEVSPQETILETSSMQWMLAYIAGYDPGKASGSLVSGGTSANLTAMTVARLRAESRDGENWDGRTPIHLFASTMAHYSVTKSCHLLAPAGLIKVTKVPLEKGGYRMDPLSLREQVELARKKREPIMGIIAVAGETETGLVDDLGAMTEIARTNNVYLHVDGAYGAPYRLSRAGHLFDAVSRADSLTVDPHKYLFDLYNSGSIMFRDGRDHARLQELNGDGEGYLFKTDPAAEAERIRNFMSSPFLGSRRLEGSMGGQSAAALNAIINYIGKDGIGALLDHTLDLTTAFVENMEGANGLQLSCETELNTICIEPAGTAPGKLDAKVETVAARLQRETGIFVSTTSLPNRDGDSGKHKVFRIVPTHPHTNEVDMKTVATELQEMWDRTN